MLSSLALFFNLLWKILWFIYLALFKNVISPYCLCGFYLTSWLTGANILKVQWPSYKHFGTLFTLVPPSNFNVFTTFFLFVFYCFDDCLIWAWSCLVWTQFWPNGFISLPRGTVAKVGQTTLKAIIRKQQLSAKMYCTSLIQFHLSPVLSLLGWGAPGAITSSLLAGKGSLLSNIQTPAVIHQRSLLTIYFLFPNFSYKVF